MFQNHDNMFAVHFLIFSGTFRKYHMQCFMNTFWYPGFLPGFQSGFLDNMKPGKSGYQIFSHTSTHSFALKCANMIGIFIVAFQKVKTHYLSPFWPIVSW